MNEIVKVTAEQVTDAAIHRVVHLQQSMHSGLFQPSDDELKQMKSQEQDLKGNLEDTVYLFLTMNPEIKATIHAGIAAELSELEGTNRWPFTAYADHRDEFGKNEMQTLFECKTLDEIYEWYNERENGIMENSFDYEWTQEIEWAAEKLKYWVEDYFEDLDWSGKHSQATDDLREELRERCLMFWDYSDIMKTAMRNSTTHILAYPLDKNGQRYEGTHYGYSKKDNDKIARKLSRKFGCTKDQVDKIYNGYEQSYLVLCGTIDAWDWYQYAVKNQKIPEHIVLGYSDSDNLYFHDAWQGSCSDGTLPVCKPEVKCKAEFQLDGAHGYGMDSICGFTGQFWRHEITFV